ncbi:MAG: CapA family protein [Oscillospiraceae bacterium]|nr:CapA family protein [Oscillospiraceae bacterium]
MELEPEPEPVNISLVMAGDVLMHEQISISGEQADGTYNYDQIFSQTTDIFSAADIAIVNDESILGGTELGLSGYPRFNAAFELGDAMVKAGFNVICYANNHAVDMGLTGLTNCLDFWRTNYPEYMILGIHDSQEDRDNLRLMEVEGVTFAFLNYTYGTNGIPLPETYSVDLLDDDHKDIVISDLERANEEADFVIVIPHWGTEYTYTPTAFQEEWAQVFLENGADLVIGAHPHVIEPVEWLEDDDGNEMLVYYSLGNFVNAYGYFYSDGSDRMLGGLASVTITADQGDVYISDYGVIPVITHAVSGTNGFTVYPYSEYTQELMDQNQVHKLDPSFTFEYCDNLFSEVFGDLFTDAKTEG